ncbi:MAG: hypothetical protein EA426_09225 [Spirochaetaceae bacterium]|nr:MAG: hypothetical protein EA426_09225 [Spirochaetaceae bacterium]
MVTYSRRRYRFFIAVFVMSLAGGLSSVTAFDVGATFETTAGAHLSADWGLLHSERFLLWADGDITRSISVAAQGSITVSVSRPFIADLDFARVSGEFPGALGSGSLLAFSVGRFAVEDPTGSVFSHAIDGVSLRTAFPSVVMSFAGGYTGFLLKGTSRILVSDADRLDEADTTVMFAPARVISLFDMTFPESIGSQTVVLGVVGNFDLRSVEYVHSLSPSFSMSGPVSDEVFYGLYGVGAVRYSADGFRYAYVAGIGVRVYLERLLASRVAVNARYASGDIGPFSLYEPISVFDAGAIRDVPIGDLLTLGAEYSLNPFLGLIGVRPDIRTSVGSRGFFRPHGAVSDLYDGFEVIARVAYRVFSDVDFGLFGGAFVPTDPTDGVTGRIEANLSLTF